MAEINESFNMKNLVEHNNSGRRNNPDINRMQVKTHRPLRGTYGRNRLGGPTHNFRRFLNRERRFLRNLPFFYPRYVDQPVYVNPRIVPTTYVSPTYVSPSYISPHFTWYNPRTWWYDGEIADHDDDDEGFENEKIINLSMLVVLLFLVMMLYIMKNKN